MNSISISDRIMAGFYLAGILVMIVARGFGHERVVLGTGALMLTVWMIAFFVVFVQRLFTCIRGKRQ